MGQVKKKSRHLSSSAVAVSKARRQLLAKNNNPVQGLISIRKNILPSEISTVSANSLEIEIRSLLSTLDIFISTSGARPSTSEWLLILWSIITKISEK